MAARRRLQVESLEDRRMLAIVVDTLVDEVDGSIIDGDISLRDAIAAATTAEVISFDGDLFSEGARTLDLDLEFGEVLINKSLTILGPGADLLTIDASGLDLDPEEWGSGQRVFDITDEVSANFLDVTIEGVTLTGADQFGDGGAIRSLENLTLIDSVVIGNQSTRGGGLYNGAGIMEIIRSTITENNDDTIDNGHLGSGITNWTGTLIVTDSTISDNGLTVCQICGVFTGGAGIYNYRGSLTVTGSAITGNSGGGIYSSGLDAAADVTISDTTISGNLFGFTSRNGLTLSNTVSDIQNSFINDNVGDGIYNRFGSLTIHGTTISGNAGYGGSGIRNLAADLTISETTISGNMTDAEGGGVDHGEGNLTITESTISGNSAGSEGGGLRIQTSPYNVEAVLISNSTISGNTSDWRGGGLWVRTFNGDSFELVHSTVTNNTSDADSLLGGEGGGVFFFYSYGTASLDHTIVAGNIRGNGGRDDIDGDIEASYSLVGDDTGATITDNGGNFIGSGGSPIDPLLAPLADNGGPTQTHLPLLGSPALDGGDSFAVAGVDVPEFDQRGNPYTRVFDGDGDTIARIDIGAVESETLHFVVDTLDDHFDGDFSEGNFTLREAIQQATLAGGGGVILFDEELFSGGPATILLDFFQQLEISTSMVIEGPGADLLTIEGQDFGRLIYIDDAINLEQVDVTIRGVTLTGGNDLNGGGAIFSQERLEVADSVITGNTAQWGGGIYNAAYGHLTLLNSSVSGNTANSSGGGIYNWGGTVLIYDSTISTNDAATTGGGVLSANNGALSIFRTTVSGNIAETEGGGLFNGDGNVHISESTFSGNTADLGGGIYSVTPTNDFTTISNSTISNNIATLGGAGVYNKSGQMVIEHSTVTENNSNDFAGSGVVSWGDSAYALTTIYSSIVAGNHHTDVAVTGGFVDTFQSNGYNIIGTGSTDAFDDPGDFVIGLLDPLLGPLQDNGGPTFTHALLAGSPAFNGGEPGLVPGELGVPLHDQRGVGYSRVRNGQIDIGAFEVQGLPGDFDHDHDVDGRDFLAWQRGESDDPFSAEDLIEWQEAYDVMGLSAAMNLSVASEPGFSASYVDSRIESEQPAAPNASKFFLIDAAHSDLPGEIKGESFDAQPIVSLEPVDAFFAQQASSAKVADFGFFATSRPVKKKAKVT